MYFPFHLATVVPDDDGQRGHDEEDQPSWSQTPPAPPVHAGSSQSPPPSAFDVHGALLDDKVQTICHTLRFAKSCPLLCLNNFLYVL